MQPLDSISSLTHGLISWTNNFQYLFTVTATFSRATSDCYYVGCFAHQAETFSVAGCTSLLLCLIETLVAVKVITAAKEEVAYGNREVVTIKCIMSAITLFSTVFAHTGKPQSSDLVCDKSYGL